jgi:hypothetical protein
MAIGKLNDQLKEAWRTYHAASRKYDKLDAEFLRRLPEPHPSIVYSPENDADGLAYYMPDHEPHSPHRSIWPNTIEAALIG